jgi:hypothetical protein
LQPCEPPTSGGGIMTSPLFSLRACVERTELLVRRNKPLACNTSHSFRHDGIFDLSLPKRMNVGRALRFGIQHCKFDLNNVSRWIQELPQIAWALTKYRVLPCGSTFEKLWNLLCILANPLTTYRIHTSVCEHTHRALTSFLLSLRHLGQ